MIGSLDVRCEIEGARERGLDIEDEDEDADEG